MRIPFRLVDVFTHRPLAGNQLCVVPDAADLPRELMQALAREIGFSETAFVTEAAGDRYAMRIFTPAAELPFAGHPSLGTVFVLAREGRVTSPATQVVEAGEFRVEADVDAGTALVVQHPPAFGPEVLDAELVAAAGGLSPRDLHPGLAPQVVSTGIPHLLVPAASEVAVGRAQGDARRLEALLEELGADGYYLFHAEGDRAHARLFAHGLGIEEDAATGSAAGPLGVYLASRGVLRSAHLVVSQGRELRRPSTLRVEVGREAGEWRVAVSGGVSVVGEGAFELPDELIGALGGASAGPA